MSLDLAAEMSLGLITFNSQQRQCLNQRRLHSLFPVWLSQSALNLVRRKPSLQTKMAFQPRSMDLIIADEGVWHQLTSSH